MGYWAYALFSIVAAFPATWFLIWATQTIGHYPVASQWDYLLTYLVVYMSLRVRYRGQEN